MGFDSPEMLAVVVEMVRARGAPVVMALVELASATLGLSP